MSPQTGTNDKKMSPEDAMKEIGSTGLKHTGGYIHEEFLSQLQGSQATKVWREMRDNDPLVGAILFVFDKLITQVDWICNPSEDDDEQATEASEFVMECLNDMEMSWSDTVSEILSMLVFGWSFHELVYKKRTLDNSNHDDGKIGWAKWPIRSQESLNRWDIGEGGRIEGMYQQAPPTYGITYLPMEKGLLFRTSVHKNNPEGRSVLRNAYRPWYFKKRIEEIEAIGIERDLAGLPVMYVPVELMRSDAADWQKAIFEDVKDIVTNIRRDEQEGVILPMLIDEDSGQQTMKLELLNAGGSRNFDTNTIIERNDRRIAMTVLADFILLGHESVGSFALSSDKTNMFAVTLGSVLRTIRDIAQKDAIPRLLKLNGIDPKYTPKLEFGDIESPALADISAYVQALVSAGVPLFPDEKLSKHLLGLAKLPEPDHDMGENVSQPEPVAPPEPTVPPEVPTEPPTGQTEQETETGTPEQPEA